MGGETILALPAFSRCEQAFHCGSRFNVRGRPASKQNKNVIARSELSQRTEALPGPWGVESAP